MSMSAADWTRSQRRRAGLRYASEAAKEVAPTAPGRIPAGTALLIPRDVGGSKIRRTASDYTNSLAATVVKNAACIFDMSVLLSIVSVIPQSTRNLILNFTLSQPQLNMNIQLYRTTANTTTGGTIVARTTTSTSYTVNDLYPYYNYYARLSRDSEYLSNLVNLSAPLGRFFAGNGLSSNTGDTGQANAASIHNPWGVTFNDSKTVMYISSPTGNQIRQVNMFSNLITTVIGDGTTEDATDTSNIAAGAAGTSVGFGNPLVLAYSEPFLFIVHGNSLVRAYNTGATTRTFAGISINSGHIRTVANIAGSALYGVATDSNGDLFLADANHRIRKMSKANGFLSVVAGTGSGGHNGDSQTATTAQLRTPTACDVDKQRNILIINDRDNRIIRAVNLNATGSVDYAGVTIPAGFIERIAGTVGVGRSSSVFPTDDGRLARNVTLADSGATWVISVDPLGNIYIGDARVCRRVDAETGIINGVTGYGGDLTNDVPAYGRGSAQAMQCAFGPDNSIYLSSFGNNNVQRIY